MYTFIITTLVIVRSINKRMYESYFLYIDGMNIRYKENSLYWWYLINTNYTKLLIHTRCRMHLYYILFQ